MVFVVLWPHLLTTKLRCLQKNNFGNTIKGGGKLHVDMTPSSIKMSGKRKRNSETTISAAHEGKKPKDSIIVHSSDSEDQISESDSEDPESDTEGKSDCVKCVEKNNKIQTLQFTELQLRTQVASSVRLYTSTEKDLKESTKNYQKFRQDWLSTKRALEESKAQSKVELEKSENQLQTEVASKKSLEISLTSRIQTLEDAKIELETEVASAQKALGESKSESKVELEKVENHLQTEVALKRSMEESLTKYRKLKQLLATKVFQSNPRNEDLDILLNLEVDELFNKYEKIITETNSDRIKLEETTETLQDVKIKLNLQTEQRGIYEKQLSEIRAVLHIPAENCNFANILPVVKDLLEQNETNHCSNGLSIVESTSS